MSAKLFPSFPRGGGVIEDEDAGRRLHRDDRLRRDGDPAVTQARADDQRLRTPERVVRDRTTSPSACNNQ
jgi:hypothetical protein